MRLLKVYKKIKIKVKVIRKLYHLTFILLHKNKPLKYNESRMSESAEMYRSGSALQ